MKSNCCQAKLWISCGKTKFDPDQEMSEYEAFLKCRTCFYVCSECNKPCDAVKEE